MKKIEMNKKTIIAIVAVAALVIAIIVGVTMCGRKENEDSDKDKAGKDNIKTEQNSDTDDATGQDDVIEDKEGGLQIMGPDEAEKQEETNKAEFINPDGTSGENGTGNEGTTGNGETTDGDEDKEENPDEDIDDNGKYGEIF